MTGNKSKSGLSAILLICISLLISCKSKNSYWDENKNTFFIPSQQLSLHLPNNDGWTIAEPAELPDNILFFGVLPEDGIGLYLFSEKDIKLKSVYDLPETEIKEQIYPIFKQSLNSHNTSYGPLEINKCTFLKKDAIKFQTNIKIENMGVRFTGYLFIHNNCLLKYVLSEPYPSESETNEAYQNILDESLAEV